MLAENGCQPCFRTSGDFRAEKASEAALMLLEASQKPENDAMALVVMDSLQMAEKAVALLMRHIEEDDRASHYLVIKGALKIRPSSRAHKPDDLVDVGRG